MCKADALSLSERRRGGSSRKFSLVLPGAVDGLSSERGAEFSLADERVVGRLGGGETG